jgi:hypothetical protein
MEGVKGTPHHYHLFWHQAICSLNLKTAVGSRKSVQVLNAPRKLEKSSAPIR